MDIVKKVMAAVGGRKMTLIIVALILVALKDVIGLDQQTIDAVWALALGGSAAIALEDSAKALAAKK